MTIRIIDVSHHNAAGIDFRKVKAAGISGVYAKCSEGSGFADQTYATVVAGCRTAGLAVGPYHFVRTTGSPAAQATFALHQAAWRPGMMPFMWDVETNDGRLNPVMFEAFLAALQLTANTAKVRQGIYTGNWFWAPQLRASRLFAALPLWSSAYTATEPVPSGWPHSTLWQYTDKAHVDGCPTPVDESVFQDDMAAWADFIGTQVVGPAKELWLLPDGRIVQPTAGTSSPPNVEWLRTPAQVQALLDAGWTQVAHTGPVTVIR